MESNFTTWDLRPHRSEIISRAATLTDAIRAGRSDTGRTITVYDPIGRVAAMMRDGQLLTTTEGGAR